MLSASAATIKQEAEREVLALYGTNGWTKEHEEVIKNLKQLEEVILFFDGDEAGKAAVEKCSKLIKELRSDIVISYVNTPLGEDPNSLIQSHEGEIIQHLIDERISTTKSENEKQKPSFEGYLETENAELLKYSTSLLQLSILGGIKITGLERLRVTLKIELYKSSAHLPIRHSLDLYNSKQVEQLVEKVSETLEVNTSAVAKTISYLTNDLEAYREEKIDRLKPKKEVQKLMSSTDRKEAMTYLEHPQLLRNTLTDITKTGIVGEVNNSLIAYLAYTSRKREKPLHIMCLGASGVGKTYLQEKVSELIPEEEKIEITSLSDNALYYFGRYELQHKLGNNQGF